MIFIDGYRLLSIIIGKDLSHYSVEVQLDCSKSSIFREIV